ncbi:ribosome-associated translation inhibitor RaiA [Nakamurella flavida]|uniref:Ribosome hibernation promoting factor n=1 Tax=Nakamurella flavida TaxID=363630 RepID=A0A938YG02_9ACTN|nr:ribosome-associated translation inhibitor RaiA [Nakamurella flavida]MBM9476991.1 ribosome-associated translation inhibitor RaiA [Nakamurella flavida]MDP9779936.1 ribosomal subunit interface protein [Nakamurella flavida]
MEIVVKGRHVEVPEHFRAHVEEKLTRIERYDPKIIRVDVELSHETNRRQSKTCQRVQITLGSRGPAVRAEASADSFYAALDAATTKLEARLKRAHDRRHDRLTERTPLGAVPVDPDLVLDGVAPTGSVATLVAPAAEAEPDEMLAEEDALSHSYGADGGPGRIVRIKDHPADPITVDQALFQMELVGHDFYLFNDADTHLSSVVYRRKGFDYGLLRLG